jgi:hypothetical protein
MATPRSSHHLSAAAAIAAAGISYPPPLPPTPHASAAAPHDAGAGGTARQIVDSLLARFLPLARRRIETAQAQVPPGSIFSGAVAEEERRLLRGEFLRAHIHYFVLLFCFTLFILPASFYIKTPKN